MTILFTSVVYGLYLHSTCEYHGLYLHSTCEYQTYAVLENTGQRLHICQVLVSLPELCSTFYNTLAIIIGENEICV
jgi:hypothetical protein